MYINLLLKRRILFVSFFWILTSVTCLSTSARGQADSTKIDSNAFAHTHKASFTGTAYLEPYWAYDFNRPTSKDIPYLYNYSRHNEFNLNVALFSGSYDDSEIRGAVAIQVGTYPMTNYAAEPSLFQHIYQASVGVYVTPDLCIDAGVFPSHLGIENALGKDQWTLTRSLVAENSPYFETGVHANYVNGPWLFCVLALNGWQNIRDLNSNKALGTQIQYAAGILTLNSSTFFGNEKPDSTPRNRIFHDFYAIVALSPVVSISGVFDLGWEQTSPNGPYARWEGTSVIARFLLSSKFAIAARGEYYYDPEQVIITTGTPNGYQTAGYSINFDYIISPQATFRIEGKYYSTKDALFERSGVAVNNSTILTSALAISF